MKLFELAVLASFAAASPCVASGCTVTGTVAAVPAHIHSTSFAQWNGFSTAEACNAKCHSPENAKCKSFAIRPSRGGGSCLLYDFDISPWIIPRAESTFTYYVLPDGVRGDVPHNVANHYTADISKTKGTYAGCREFCLKDERCSGFGYRDNHNCRLYDVSLAGKVKAKDSSLYIQYQADCKAI